MYNYRFLGLFLFALLFSIGQACLGPPCSSQIYFEAVLQSDTKSINRCISSGTDVNLTNEENKTALIIAAEQGDADLVNFLLNRGANTFIVDDNENYASRAAEQQGHEAISDAIRAFQYNGWRTVSDRFTDRLFQRAVQFDVDQVVQAFIDEGYNIVDEGENQIPPLPQAIFSGSRHVVPLLLKNDVDPNTEFDTRPALMISALFGELEIARSLIEAGADIDLPDEPGTTALMLAAEYGYTEMVELLLNAGADPNLKDIMEETALNKAEKGDHQDIIDLLNREAKGD